MGYSTLAGGAGSADSAEIGKRSYIKAIVSGRDE